MVAFVGREQELSRLGAALGGEARLLLVVGDAGIGKTRFVTEGLRLAAAGGLIGVSGGCLPLAAKLPLLPVTDALGELGRLEQGRVLEAAVGMTPPYVRVELARLLPQLGPAGEAAGDRAEGWQQERLFTAIAELLETAARQERLALVIEDVHWADSATLDFLTFLMRGARRSAVTVVATCRSDEAPLDPQVTGWLAHVRGREAVAEIRLCPLSAAETADQVASLAGGGLPAGLATDVYARGEGNPFFTEQLVAATLADNPAGEPGGLPARLGELLAARLAGCGDDARAALAALAVAGRPLTEELLATITELDETAVQRALRELATARLLADSAATGAYRPRHALLAEAAASDLLPGELKMLHERTAWALQAIGDESLAAELAGHWAAAGQLKQELSARVAAATAAERVFAFAEASGHWQRAIELHGHVPGAATGGLDLPRMYLRTIDALEIAGEIERARALADDAYRRFASNPDRATAAVIRQRAGHFRGLQTQFSGARDGPDAGLPLIEEALRLFEGEPVSADQAEAWYDYGVFLYHSSADEQARDSAMRKAFDIAQTVGATSLIPRILSFRSYQAFYREEIEEGFALLDRGRALAEAAGDAEGALYLAVDQSHALTTTGKFDDAAGLAVSGLAAAREAGRQTSLDAAMLVSNAVSAMLARGRTAEAAALIDPLTQGSPDRDHWILHDCRIQADTVRGDLPAATERCAELRARTGRISSDSWGLSTALSAAELGLWAGRPADALDDVRQALALVTSKQRALSCGRLLAVGLRACADLAEGARARRDEQAEAAARAAAADLAAWLDRMDGAPFSGHAFIAAAPAERATWDAERTRLEGTDEAGAWETAAKAWEDRGWPHWAGYAWWRYAEVMLAAGNSRAAATALRTAAGAAQTHAPLLADIRKLAERARIPLQTAPDQEAARPPAAPRGYGLTERELAVLRLLAAGRTNAQIGAELYMSPKTASVHVSSIMRKLGVTSRVQAAAVAERAGLLLEQPALAALADVRGL